MSYAVFQAAAGFGTWQTDCISAGGDPNWFTEKCDMPADTAALKCVQAGGRFDFLKKTCVMPDWWSTSAPPPPVPALPPTTATSSDGSFLSPLKDSGNWSTPTCPAGQQYSIAEWKCIPTQAPKCPTGQTWAWEGGKAVCKSATPLISPSKTVGPVVPPPLPKIPLVPATPPPAPAKSAFSFSPVWFLAIGAVVVGGVMIAKKKGGAK